MISQKNWLFFGQLSQYDKSFNESSALKTGHVKVSGLPNSIIVQNNLIRPIEENVHECLYGLINAKFLKLLYILTQWSHQWQRMKNNQQQDVTHKRKRSKKANEDVISHVLSRESKKRSSSLPESRATSGVEILTDQLGMISNKNKMSILTNFWSQNFLTLFKIKKNVNNYF